MLLLVCEYFFLQRKMITQFGVIQYRGYIAFDLRANSKIKLKQNKLWLYEDSRTEPLFLPFLKLLRDLRLYSTIRTALPCAGAFADTTAKCRRSDQPPFVQYPYYVPPSRRALTPPDAWQVSLQRLQAFLRRARAVARNFHCARPSSDLLGVSSLHGSCLSDCWIRAHQYSSTKFRAPLPSVRCR